MRLVFLFGNGLSQGFDGRLGLGPITERVRRRLGADAQVLEELAVLARPEDPDVDLSSSRTNFEHLAGPLDRLAQALVALEPLARTDVHPLRALRRASEELRHVYVKVVGIVLAEIDRCCIESDPDDERRRSWDELDAFVGELVGLADNHEVSLYTLNYDSLLISAILKNCADRFYDGFPGNVLDTPLDRWPTTPIGYYHLHGSVSWVEEFDGSVVKYPLDRIRQVFIPRWQEGDGSAGWPLVVLGDLKSPIVRRYPFLLFYEEFRRDLEESDLVVAAGYGFGDLPVNRELAVFLARRAEHQLYLWIPDAEEKVDRVLARLARHSSRRISRKQILPMDVRLPDVGFLGSWAAQVVADE